MPAKFVIKVARDGQFHFTFLSSEGKRLLTSELYKAKASAYNGIASIRRNATDEDRYDRLTAKNGKLYFTLKAGNHEIIGMSDFFDTEDQREDAILLVMLAAGSAVEEEEAPPKRDKAEVLKTIEARKLNKRTMRPISSATVVIPYGAIVSQLKEEDRRLQFTYLGEVYDADLSRLSGALRFIG